MTGNVEIKKKLTGRLHVLRKIHGYSAYDLAVQEGYQGTLTEWLASLKGDKGDAGTLEAHTEVDALGNRVINVADATEDTDAVNLKALKGLIKRHYIQGETDSSGIFSFPLKAANYLVLSVFPSSDKIWQPLVDSSTNYLSFRVLDIATGEPVANTTIYGSINYIRADDAKWVMEEVE